MECLFLILLPIVTVAGNLTPKGANVCKFQERYSVIEYVKETYQEQYTTTKWCFRVPPRCTVYNWRTATRTVPQQVNKSREVSRCCEGYVQQREDCKAVCFKPCRHGICSSPDTCTCFPGFRGKYCEEICVEGTYGRNCTEKCECLNNAFCNAMSGSCLCTPGWRGKRCGDPCAAGFFGHECRMQCYCDDTSSTCHHITGECPATTTVLLSTTEVISSTSIHPTSTTEEETSTITQSTTTIDEFSSTPTAMYSTTTTLEDSTTEEETSTITPSTTIDEFSSTPTTMNSTTTTLEGSRTAEEPTTPAFTTTSTTQETTTEYFKATISTEEFTSSTIEPFMTNSTFFGRNNVLLRTPQMTIFEEATTVSTSSGNQFIDNGATTLSGDSKTVIGIERKVKDANIVGLSIAISFSVLCSLILLFGAASLAFSKHRKLPIPSPSDFGLYDIYAETSTSGKPVLMNPTYGCVETELFPPKSEFITFKADTGSFETELREILESEYDHPPLPISRSSTPFGHLYDEIENRRIWGGER